MKPERKLRLQNSVYEHAPWVLARMSPDRARCRLISNRKDQHLSWYQAEADNETRADLPPALIHAGLRLFAGFLGKCWIVRVARRATAIISGRIIGVQRCAFP